MATYIPAIRTQMGGLEYFVSAVTLGEAARLIDYVEEIDGWTTETPPQLRLQRTTCNASNVRWCRTSSIRTITSTQP